MELFGLSWGTLLGTHFILSTSCSCNNHCLFVEQLLNPGRNCAESSRVKEWKFCGFCMVLPLKLSPLSNLYDKEDSDYFLARLNGTILQFLKLDPSPATCGLCDVCLAACWLCITSFTSPVSPIYKMRKLTQYLYKQSTQHKTPA